MNVYLRKMLGYTSETLLEFYRYLLTPPSLEEVLENNRRGVCLCSAAVTTAPVSPTLSLSC